MNNRDSKFHIHIYKTMLLSYPNVSLLEVEQALVDAFAPSSNNPNEKVSNNNIKRIHIIKAICELTSFIKNLIIKNLTFNFSPFSKFAHFIEKNLLRQTTYYKLNTTRP